jgi:hypothetical protein
MAEAMRNATAARVSARRPESWDPYPVWRILLRLHPARDEDPAGSVGRLDRDGARLFLQTIVDYPDYLQDTLLVIAHGEGVIAAVSLLDEAVRRHLARERGRSFSG